MNSLEKFEEWLLRKNLLSRKFISPLDRIASKLGYAGPPLIFFDFEKLGAILAFWFLIGFSSLSCLVCRLALGISNFQSFDEYSFFVLGAGSVFFGFIASFFLKRAFKEHQIPQWDEISREQ